MKINNLLLAFSSFISKALFYKQKIKLQPGDIAPAFALADETGVIRTLQECKGSKVVLFFYPKDETPGCTAQACRLRDAFAMYKENNIILLGVSYDSVKSHANFQEKNNLPFHLLSDPTGITAFDYQANRFWLSNIYPKRKTILIDEKGKIVTIMNKVNVQNHSDEILKAFGY